MSVSRVGLGTPDYDDSTSGSITPSLPAGIQVGDLLIVFASGSYELSSAPTVSAGWTYKRQFYGAGSDSDMAGLLAYRIATGSDSAPTISWSGGTASIPMVGQVVAYRSTTGFDADPWDDQGTLTDDTGSENNIGPVGGVTGTAADSFVLVVGARFNGSAWSVTTLSQSGLTFSELSEPYYSGSAYGYGFVWDECLDAGLTPITAKTFNVSTSNQSTWFGFMEAIKPTGATYSLSGVTKDKTGSVLGSCDVFLVQDNQDGTMTFIEHTTSDPSTGAYEFTGLQVGANLCVIAWKDNTPHVMDATDWVLTGTEE